MAGDYESQRISIDAPVPGTCEWFLAHHKFTAWTQAKSSSILWLTANPGCGKSVLSNFLVESLQKSHPEAIMCYFFFKNGDQTRTESHQAICALLHQLLMRLPEGVKSVLEAFSAKDHNLTSRNVEGLWKIFTAIVKEAKSPPVFFVIDALDECSEESRNRLIDLLSSKFSQPESDDRLPGPVRVLATSRPWPTIERRFKQSSTIRLRGEDETRISKDIEAMVNYKLQEFSEIESLSPETKDLIGQRLLSGADQTFLWVSLVFDQLAQLQSRTLKSVRKALENIPTQLDQLYETTFSQFQDKNASSRLLRLIVAAKEPLHLDEINILLNIDRDTESLNLLRQDLEPNMEYATKQLGGFFIRIINSRVHLVHQTAREFLLQGKTELHSNITTPHIDLDYGESEIAEACIRFLTLPDIPQRDSLPSKKDDLPRLNHQFVLQLPVWARLFYPYAAINWGVTKGAEAAAARDKGLEVDMHLLCDAEETIFPGWWCFYAMKNPSPWGPIFWCDNPNFAHLSIARGHFAISKMLIETGSCKTNSRDSQGRDVLFIATWERQWEHFEWLLSRFSFSEAQIGSALIAAALQPHMDILNSLIKTGVDLNASYDFKGGTETPGENAIWRTDILEPFLNNGLVVTDEQIMGTAKCGYSEPLKLLLVHDVRDNESKRAVLNQALREAAYWGYVDCYDIIMSFAPELIVQAPDISRGLEQAILRADSYNLTRLLSKGADASEALSIASQLGHAQTTEILLQARTYSGQQLNEALAVFFDVHTSPELGEYVFNRMQSVLTSTDSGVRLHNAFKVVPSFKQGMSYLGLYLERGAKITPEQYIKSTSQAIALDEEFANFLLDNISRLQNSALKQEDFLPLACLWGKTGVVEAIVNRSEGQMNNQEGLAIDPIFISTASGNPDVVRYILQKGADPRRVFECSIKRPLDPLASVYFQELIRLLGGCISESAISLARRLKYGDIEKLLETTQPP